MKREHRENLTARELKAASVSRELVVQEVRALQKEAHEAMDRLLARREQLRRQLRATEIAEHREHQRNEERERE